MNKKRTSLEDFISSNEGEISKVNEIKQSKSKKIHLSVYLKPQIYEQLRLLAFEERKKLHDYLMEGLDKIFEMRGLPSIQNLENKK